MKKMKMMKMMNKKVQNDYIAIVPTEKKMNCNMCDGELEHFNYNGTFIWLCEHCPNIQFELINDNDAPALIEFLKLDRKEKEE